MYIPLHPAWTPNQHPPLNRALHVSHGISGPRHAVASVGCGHCRKISCRQSNRLRFQERWPSVLKTQAPKAPTNASFYQVAWKLRMRAQKTHFRSLGKKWCQKPTNKQSEHIYICICMCVCMCVFSRHMTPSNLSPVPTRCKAAPDHSWDILGWPTWIPPEASWWEGWGRSRNQKRSSSHHYTTLLKFAGLFFLDFTGGFHLNANVSSCPVRDHLHEEHWGFRRLQSR